MEIRRTLILSTAHIKEETLMRFKSHPHVADFEFGAYFYANPLGIDQEVPEDLRTVLEFARAEACCEVKFDADADEIDQLPTYDWGN